MGAISYAKRVEIVTLMKEGKSTRGVAKQLSIAQSTVAKIWKKFGNTGSFENLPKSGRPRKIDERLDRVIERSIKKGECQTSVEVRQMLKNHHRVEVHMDTVRRSLKRSGLVARVKRAKPLLRPANIKKRLAFARKYQHWTADDWRKVIFSDESRFKVFGSDGRQYCWVKPGDKLTPRQIKPTVKHGGGSVFVWGCMTSQGVGYLCKIDEGLDSKLYIEILGDELKETLRYYKLRKDSVIFQQDNDPKHTAKATQQWLKDSKYKVLDWVAQSPDLNPIEHLWDHVQRSLRALPVHPKSVPDLWEKLQQVWENIDLSVIDKLYESMPKRIAAVIEAKGGYTTY
jgi:transposase